jgi:catecholate siderophore receptor
MFRVSVAALLATTFLAAPALAADAGDDEVKLAELSDPIVVIGDRGGYEANDTCTATKTCTPLKDVPQSVTVVMGDQINDQALRSMADVMTLVPGASAGTGEGNRDQVVLRGNNSTADFFVDGLRDDVQYFRDFYNIDRVEVLKGPNAMIFGRGGGGGVINRVTKRSTLKPNYEIVGWGDSEGGIRLGADLDQPLAEGVGIRLNGFYENGDSFRHHVDLKRYAINPVLGVAVGNGTRIDLSYEHLHDRRTADRGVPSDARGGLPTIDNPNEPIDGFDSTFFGNPDLSFAKFDANVATVAVEHDFGSGLTLRSRTLYGDYDKFYQNVYPGGPVVAATATLPERFALGAYNNSTDRKNLFSQTDLVWAHPLGGIDQTLLVGFELGHQKSRNFRQTGSIVGGNTTPLDNATIFGPTIFASVGTDANNRTKADVAAVYIQEQLRPASWLEIVAGLRFDRFKLKVDDFRPAPFGGKFSRNDDLWSPRLGVILKPNEQLSLYASYSRSFLPQSGDQFSGLTIDTEGLKPEKFVNYEIGAKWEPVKGLLATAAIYQLDRTNTRVANPNGSGTSLLSGKQRSKGLEVGVAGNVTGHWQVSAGYALQKAEVIAATTACPAGDCKVPLVPRNTFSLWNRYDVTDSLGLGLGVIARSKSYASISNLVKLPGYTRLDAALFYQFTPKIGAQINIENLLGKDYFASSNGDNNIAPGAPTTVRAALRFDI